MVEMLSLDGHGIDFVMLISEAREYAQTVTYHLILLDIMLIDGDGRAFLQELRLSARDVPVMVLTARSEVSDRVSVLDLGADDYLVKPFEFTELEARCRAIPCRLGGGATNHKRIGNVEFDLLVGVLKPEKTRVDPRNRELRLFEVFTINRDAILSKPKLVDRIFSADKDVSENAIEVYVDRLRKHLLGSSVQIVTVRGLG